MTLTEPVDVLLNLARITPEELMTLAAHVNSGGVVVNSVSTIPTPVEEERGVRAVGVFVRSDARQLAHQSNSSTAATSKSTSPNGFR